MASRQRDDAFSIGEQERAGADEQRTGPALDERCKGCLDVAVAGDIENDELLPDRLRCGLHVFSLRLGIRTCPGSPAWQLLSPWARAGAAAPVASPLTRWRKRPRP